LSEVKSTLHGIDKKVVGKEGARFVTMISLASEINSKIGDSYEHEMITSNYF
jgi:hypothetical protein